MFVYFVILFYTKTLKTIYMFFNIFSKNSFYVALIKHLWRYSTPLNSNYFWVFNFLFYVFFLPQVYCDDVVNAISTLAPTSEENTDWQSLEWQSFQSFEKFAFIVALTGIITGMTISVIIYFMIKKNYTNVKNVNSFVTYLFYTDYWRQVYAVILTWVLCCISFAILKLCYITYGILAKKLIYFLYGEEIINKNTPVISEISHDSCCDEPYKPWQQAIIITSVMVIVKSTFVVVKTLVWIWRNS